MRNLLAGKGFGRLLGEACAWDSRRVKADRRVAFRVKCQLGKGLGGAGFLEVLNAPGLPGRVLRGNVDLESISLYPVAHAKSAPRIGRPQHGGKGSGARGQWSGFRILAYVELEVL